MGVFAFVTLAGHGATFLAWKTEGSLHDRSVLWAVRACRLSLVLSVAVSALTFVWVPEFFHPVVSRPWLWPLPIAAGMASLVVLRSLPRGQPLRAFLASCTSISLWLLATAGALYPVVLRSTLSKEFSLDIGSATKGSSLWAAAWLLTPGFVLALVYFVVVFRRSRGKVTLEELHF